MNKAYILAVGLEIHAELNTKSKIFCSCANRFGAPPNTLCCPVCMGLPGALPLLNRQVVLHAVKAGLAMHCKINNTFTLARKNYFYPDLPKGYQITQHTLPLCEDGFIEILLGGGLKTVGIQRIHIEEDAGKLLHGVAGAPTLADYNRSGVPLIEIVTQPDLHSAEEAAACVRTVANTLRSLSVSNVKMQQGNLRADVNVSVRPKGQRKHGTRTEMKNINGFAAVQRAVAHEGERQWKLLQSGTPVQMQTLRWNDAAGKSVPLRTKEQAQDYRYLDEPDTGVFHVPAGAVSALQKTLPEPMAHRAVRLYRQYHITLSAAQLLAASPASAAFFEQTLACDVCEAQTTANWMLGDCAKLLKEQRKTLDETALTPQNFAQLLQMLEGGTLNSTGARQVLQAILLKDTAPALVAQNRGLLQISEGQMLENLVHKVLAQNPKAVQDYHNGKSAAFGFLMGRCMRSSGGRANPNVLQQLLTRHLTPKTSP